MIRQLCGSGGLGLGEGAGELERLPKHFGTVGLGRSPGNWRALLVLPL